MGAMRAWYSCSSRNELRKTTKTRMDSHHCRLPLDRVRHTPLSGHCSKVSLCGNLESCSRPWTWNADSPRLLALSILQYVDGEDKAGSVSLTHSHIARGT